MSRSEWNAQLRRNARDEAYKKTWYDIYRHQIRYSLDEHFADLDITPEECKLFKKYQRMYDTAELPVKFVTVNLPDGWVDESEDHALLRRCLKKCYVGDWHFAFELGPNEDHPHYHVYFKSEVHQLDPSRIISEWSKIFNIKKNFVNVEATSYPHISTLEGYISKEKIFKDSQKTQKKTLYQFKKIGTV